MSKYKPIQQIVKHSDKCAMLNGLNGDQPWCLPKQVSDHSWTPRDDQIQRDLLGRKNPRARHTWLEMRCSDPSCNARLIIYWPTFERALGLSDSEWKEKESVSAQDSQEER
jgi:hypothetical protein